MYPYRRNNQRKRSRTGTRRNKSAGRRLPGSARELLPLMQPATKALAQVLAGNTKPSGQFVYARSMAERADQMIAEKQLDRLTMRDREEFLEQLARLKLTVTDAEDEFGPLEAEGATATATATTRRPRATRGKRPMSTRIPRRSRRSGDGSRPKRPSSASGSSGWRWR